MRNHFRTKRMKSILYIFFAVSMIVSLVLSGCSKTSNTGGKDERMKISLMYPLYSNPPKKNDIWEMMEEKFNVELDLMAVPSNNYEEKLQVMVASGDMPDAAVWTAFPDAELNKYIEQGAFQALDTYIEDAPHIMETPEEVFDTVRNDGKIYGIPRTRALVGSGVIIRKDWLDNLGLPIPKTVDEFYETAIKFTTDDPDGNGKDDTFGIVMGENVSHADSINMAFDTGNGWRVQEDGTLMSADITPQRKKALGWFRDLYAEGGIDKDFPVLKNTQVWEKLEGGKGGIMITGQTSDFARYVENLAKVEPEGELIMIDPPIGPTGTSGFIQTSGFFGQWVIPHDRSDEKVKKVIEILDWQASEEALELKRYGLEDIHHKVNDDGTKTITDQHGDEGVGNLIGHNSYDPYAYVVLHAPEEVQRLQKENLDRVADMGIANPVLSYVSPTFLKKGTDLAKTRDEYFVKIVTGELPLDAFDQFVEKWLKDGGQKITEEVNEWYENEKK
ncbi:putative aldouronate transport system substrate-binding protein [Lederbergia galactosidilyticus]|uniref:extracellular solute-binding protein n=1 Tax=Lederbergia galactosidilytica TaxID=217031 RepID=UPI001AE43C53|nr:extracellular solute-binding protein [Lederbergia galactosidilytica]MBP1917398.1 putative aldouronate transport system substrate-binding protein [Lederbergia galactosidilytica]